MLRRPTSAPGHNVRVGSRLRNWQRMKRLLLIAALGLVAAGCGGGSTKVEQTPATTTQPPTTVATTTPAETRMSLPLYFLAPDGKLVADSRSVPASQAYLAALLHELTSAPASTTTHVPERLLLTIAGGRAKVSGATLSDAALAQVVYSLTSFPSVQSVNGKTRADVEDFAPAILVEHPTPFERVKSPLDMNGTANTFEATFNYRLEDANGKALAKDFVTATSGNGTRGTFDFSVPFTVDVAQDGKLAVFELSAEDGSVIHEREIPLRLVP
jgi:Immunoglobulin-like domain of bacterial spore germination/Sporulation and spore germination